MIPSYDDLTPGIPDVVDSESVDQLALFLHEDLHRKPGDQQQSSPKSPGLLVSCIYACLRTANCELPASAKATARQALMDVARDFSPRVMLVSESEVLLDVSGLGALIGEPPVIAQELRRALGEAGANGYVAIAPTQTVARVLARFPDCPIARFPELPVSLLEPLETLPPATNHRDRARPYEIFEKWGIATLGELAALPAPALSSRLGRRGVALQRLARGLDARPFVPDGETPRFVERLELEWPLDTLEPLSFVFARLLEPLSAALERADRGAAAIRLDLRLADRATHARVLQLPAPMRDAKVLRTLLLLDLESHPPAAAVDTITIELDPAPARITQFSLLQRALPSPETLATLTARLSALVGESRVGTPVLLDTHQPDAFEMHRYAPNPSQRTPEPPNANHRTPELQNPRTSEPPNSRTPELQNPRTSGAPTLQLRRRRVPPAIRVSIERGRPVYVASARGLPQGAVTQAAGPWRSSGGWWIAPKPRSGEGGWNRDEWDVALSNGAACRIFHDRTADRWFLEAIYD